MELSRGFGHAVLGASLRAAFHDCAVTVYLDGSGVGSRMSRCDPCERRVESREVEDEVRTRYRAGIQRVGEEWKRYRSTEKYVRERRRENKPASSAKFPLEVVFIGGDDVCVALHEEVARGFLEGFLSLSTGSLRWAGVVLLHGSDHFELVRLHEARSRLMQKAKRMARSSGHAVSLVLARLKPLEECAVEDDDVLWFDQEQTASDLVLAADRWPQWEVPH